MSEAKIISVNVGKARDAGWAGRMKRTAIDKRAAEGRVAVRRLGLDGDEQADLEHHGGVYQAVYVYAQEDYAWWQSELGRDLRDGQFGENITTSGLDVSGASLGERWRIGSALCEVTAPRIPCGVFRNWMEETGWVKRFANAARPGAYLRVIEEGHVAAGDPAVIVSRPGVRVTVAEAVRGWYGDAGILRRILTLPERDPDWDERAARVLTAGAT